MNVVNFNGRDTSLGVGNRNKNRTDLYSEKFVIISAIGKLVFFKIQFQRIVYF